MRPVVGGLPAGDHHHPALRNLLGQTGGDIEAVDVGELDVEEDHVGPALADEGDGGAAIRGLPGDPEALLFQELSGLRSEALVVVHDREASRVPWVQTRSIGSASDSDCARGAPIAATAARRSSLVRHVPVTHVP